MPKIFFTSRAEKDLEKLEYFIKIRILNQIEKWKQGFDNFVFEKLHDKDYKSRVGDYRIIFRIKNDCIEILRVGHRKNIYKKYKG